MKKLIFLVLLLLFVDSSYSGNKVLVFGGKTGWIGRMLVEEFKKQGDIVHCATSRLENRESIIREIEMINPDFIVNAAGITGRPTVDWCEDHRSETLRANVLGLLDLVDIAYLHGIHVTNLSTGCIYTYDNLHPMGSGKSFSEIDEPNFDKSFYSKTKIIAEKLILCYPNVLNLRISKPISTDLCLRSYVGKIIRYKRIVNIPNSVCILEDLLPLIPALMSKKIVGNFNFVNPGTITHREIKEMYQQYIDPLLQYEVFSEAEQNKILKVPRANAELDCTKLRTFFPNIPDAKTSLRRIFWHLRESGSVVKK